MKMNPSIRQLWWYAHRTHAHTQHIPNDRTSENRKEWENERPNAFEAINFRFRDLTSIFEMKGDQSSSFILAFFFAIFSFSLFIHQIDFRAIVCARLRHCLISRKRLYVCLNMCIRYVWPSLHMRQPIKSRNSNKQRLVIVSCVDIRLLLLMGFSTFAMYRDGMANIFFFSQLLTMQLDLLFRATKMHSTHSSFYSAISLVTRWAIMLSVWPSGVYTQLKYLLTRYLLWRITYWHDAHIVSYGRLSFSIEYNIFNASVACSPRVLLLILLDRFLSGIFTCE